MAVERDLWVGEQSHTSALVDIIETIQEVTLVMYD